MNYNAFCAWGSIAGGALAIAGAILPWLTLDGGLQRYGGTTGIYGWLVLTAGALAVAGGVGELRAPAAWLVQAKGMLGVALAAFTMWLLIGLHEVVSRPGGAMFAPAAGPGLFVALAGSLTIFACAFGALTIPLLRRHWS